MVPKTHRTQMQRLREAHPELQHLPDAVYRITRRKEMPLASVITASDLS